MAMLAKVKKPFIDSETLEERMGIHRHALLKFIISSYFTPGFYSNFEFPVEYFSDTTVRCIHSFINNKRIIALREPGSCYITLNSLVKSL